MDKITEAVARAIRGAFCKRYQDSGARSWDALIKFEPNSEIVAIVRDEARAAITAYESEAKARIAELEAALKPFAEMTDDKCDGWGVDYADLCAARKAYEGKI